MNRPLSVAISGSAGLIGSKLAAYLESGGHRVRPLVRRRARPATDEISWDPIARTIDAAALEGIDAVVHLAGAGIASGRWTAGRKARIRDSRIEGTRFVAETLAGLARPPRVLLSASAIGFYGDRGDEPLDETAPAGRGFLAETCQAWERAAEPAERAGLRLVTPRIGLVLTREGGALARMLPAFRLGLGGRIGSGRQFMSWIAREDLIRVLHHALFDETVSGPLNAVAPTPVRNAEFARTLGQVLRRPARLPLPATLVRLLFGEMGRELLLAGARVVPRKLERSGFGFDWSDLEQALSFELGRAASSRGSRPG